MTEVTFGRSFGTETAVTGMKCHLQLNGIIEMIF